MSERIAWRFASTRIRATSSSLALGSPATITATWVALAAMSFRRWGAARKNSVERGSDASITPSPGLVRATNTLSPQAYDACRPRGTHEMRSPSAASTRNRRPYAAVT